MTEQERLEEVSRQRKIECARKEMQTTEDKKTDKYSKGFQIRLLIASVLFLCFLISKQENLTYKNIDCKRIQEIVQYDVGVDFVEEKIISVFHRLN